MDHSQEPATEVFTAKVTPSTIATLDKYANGAGCSRAEAGRVFMSYGVEMLTQPGAIERLESCTLLNRLEHLAASWSAGRCTSGSRWFDELPPAEDLARMELPAVVSTPGLVMAVDYSGQSLQVAFGTEVVIGVTTASGDGSQSEVHLGDLVAMVGQMGSALVELVNSKPGRTARLHLGMELARLESGQIRIAYGTLRMLLPVAEVFRLLAELNGAVAQHLAGSVARREALEKTLQESPVTEVEAER